MKSNAKISDRSLQVLLGIIRHGVISGSYLFYGPALAFPNDAARFFAQGLNCLSLTDSGPCAQCDSCLKFEHRNFPDYIELVSEKALSVDDIRGLQDQVKYGPSQGKRLVVVVPDCHTMSTQAANAFLKTLEEPPEGVTFVLITSILKSILPTIRSRCQLLDIPAFSIHDCRDLFPNMTDAQLRYRVETGEASELNFIELADFLSLSHVDRLQKAQELSQDKIAMRIQFEQWAETICNAPLTQQSMSNLKLIIENMSHLQYNLNKRLQIDALAMRLV